MACPEPRGIIIQFNLLLSDTASVCVCTSEHIQESRYACLHIFVNG